MPGFSESIGTHEIHPMNMTLSFFSSGTTDLDIKEAYLTYDHATSFHKELVVRYQCKTCSPQTRREDMENDDDYGVQLNLHSGRTLPGQLI